MVDPLTVIATIIIVAGIAAVIMIAWGRELNKLRRLIVPRKINLPPKTEEKC